MDKTSKLAKEYILFSMEAVKDEIVDNCRLAYIEQMQQLSEVMKNLSEAYKNIK